MADLRLHGFVLQPDGARAGDTERAFFPVPAGDFQQPPADWLRAADVRAATCLAVHSSLAGYFLHPTADLEGVGRLYPRFIPRVSCRGDGEAGAVVAGEEVRRLRYAKFGTTGFRSVAQLSSQFKNKFFYLGLSSICKTFVSADFDKTTIF